VFTTGPIRCRLQLEEEDVESGKEATDERNSVGGKAFVPIGKGGAGRLVIGAPLVLDPDQPCKSR
jgi:hypothetical protein